MKRILSIIALTALALSAGAQNPTQPQPAIHTTVSFALINPPNAPQSVNVHLVGVPGFTSQTIYYWLVSEYPIGNSNLSGPWTAYNAPSTLSSSNYEVISFQAVAGANSYDVLKTSTPFPPTGACNCAVAVATTSTTVNDQTNSTSSYTVNVFNTTGAIIQLANQPTGAPGAAHLILSQGGQQIADLSQGGGGDGGGCSVNPADGGCAISGTPSVDLFIGGVGGGTGWIEQVLSNQVNFAVPVNVTGPPGQAGVYSFGCGTDPGVGSGVAITAAICSGFVPYTIFLPSQAGSGYLQFSNTANKVTSTFEPSINLAGDVAGLLPLANGGTNGTTQATALANILNPPTRNGDICCFYIAGAYQNLPGNNAGGGQTGFITENGTGSPGFVIVPIPANDGGTGLLTMTLNTVYKGNNISSMLATNLSENTGKTSLLYSGGTFQQTAIAFSTLPTCNSGAEGSRGAVTDSTTATWGATITGSGANHVLAYCDGTNWTVAAK